MRKKSTSQQWAFIEAEAAALGVGPKALEKWRVRGVPYRWRLPLLDRAHHRKIMLSREIFDNPPFERRRITDKLSECQAET
jgi:hypothetical protein